MNIGKEGVDWELDETGHIKIIKPERDTDEITYPEHGDIGYGYYDD